VEYIDKERKIDNMQNERQLLRAARKLDEKALLDIFDHFAPQVYVRALNLCHDPVQADDIVSNVFAFFLDEMANGKGPNQDLKTYLYQSADHLNRNH
jgi:DNA-directed RNA polymerase specialized sigma24 family protein